MTAGAFALNVQQTTVRFGIHARVVWKIDDCDLIVVKGFVGDQGQEDLTVAIVNFSLIWGSERWHIWGI